MVLLVSFIFFRSLDAAPTEAPDCIVCEQTISEGRFWKHSKGAVCRECFQIPTKCWICSLPMKQAALRLTDGRQICDDEAPHVVVGKERAQAVYDSVQSTLQRMTEGKLFLTSSNVPVTVYDLRYLQEKEEAGEDVSERQVGMSHTLKRGREISHEVLLLSGQPVEDLRAVSAHEFAHLWLNENLPAGRDIEPDTIEAICELIAWKLMEFERRPDVMDRIEANGYSKGRITELLDFQSRYGLNNVLDWAVRGKGATMTEEYMREFTGNWINRSAFAQIKVEPKAAPRGLRLKGILGSGRNAMAMINEVSLRQGESDTVRLATGDVRIRCEEIGRTHVVVVNEATGLKLRLEMGTD